MKEPLGERIVGYLPQIRRVARRIVGNGDVDDITQECCVRLLEKEWARREPGKLTPWINTITRHLTLDWLSARHRRQTKVAFLSSKALDERGGPSSDSEENAEWVAAQWRYLTPTQERVIRLRYYENLGVTEVASRLGLSHATVSHHMKGALETLRRRARAQRLLPAFFPWSGRGLDLGPTLMGASIVKSKLAGILLVLMSLFFGSFYLESKLANERLAAEISELRRSEAVVRAGGENALSSLEKELDELRRENRILTARAKSKDVPSLSRSLHAAESRPGDSPAGVSRTHLRRTLDALRRLNPATFDGWSIEDLEEYILDPIAMGLSDVQLTGDDFDDLSHIPKLWNLSLTNCRFSADSLARLDSGLPLRYFDLDSSTIDDEGLEHLRRFEIESLLLNGGAVSDEGLAHLAGVDSLVDLKLDGTRVEGPGLRHVSDSLRSLSLKDTSFSDASLDAIQHLRNLNKLSLEATEITDQGMPNLRDFLSRASDLRLLSLDGTGVSDAGFEVLLQADLDNLRELRVKGTKISEAALEDLSRRYPRVRIVR